MATLATGQISIIDYNDALTLTGFIGSNHPKTQMFNPDNNSYIPNWESTNLVLTPSLYKIGTTSDIITSADVTLVKWFEAGSSTAIASAGNYELSGTKSHILTIKANILAGLPSKDWVCEVTFRDPSTGLTLINKMGISFSRVTNGGGITAAIAWSPDGNVFKNSDVTTLKAQCDLWRGSVVDTTDVTYQWFKQDSTATSDTGGGIGWAKLTNSSGMHSGVTTNTLTIYANAVINYAVYKCIITDTEQGANNAKYMDTASFIDNSDPIQVVIESSGGDIFKNGVGSTTLKARLFQAGAEIDTAGTTYTYRWKKFDKDGNLVSAFSKTGKSTNVGSDDVDTKATFSVEVSK